MTHGKDETFQSKGSEWSIRFIAGYWRLSRDRVLIATFNSKGAAKAGMAVEKRRLSPTHQH